MIVAPLLAGQSPTPPSILGSVTLSVSSCALRATEDAHKPRQGLRLKVFALRAHLDAHRYAVSLQARRVSAPHAVFPALVFPSGHPFPRRPFQAEFHQGENPSRGKRRRLRFVRVRRHYGWAQPLRRLAKPPSPRGRACSGRSTNSLLNFTLPASGELKAVRSRHAFLLRPSGYGGHGRVHVHLPARKSRSSLAATSLPFGQRTNVSVLTLAYWPGAGDHVITGT